MFPEVSEQIADKIRTVGLEPIYVATFFVLILLAFDVKKIRHWGELRGREKHWIAITAVAAVLLTCASALAFFKGP